MEYKTRNELLKENKGILKITADLWDVPTQIKLNENFPFTGFIGKDGTIYECKPFEHDDLIRNIVYNNPEYFEKYKNIPATCYDRIPQGMLQEEYFLMKYLGFVKVFSFREIPTMKLLSRYETLTPEQSNVIYPQ